MLKVSGLWLNEGKDKQKYFSGSMGGVRILIFKNTFKKEGSNEPDYQMYFDEQAKKDTKEDSSEQPLNDDIPF